MLPYSFIGMWSYTNPATAVAVNVPMTDKPDWIFVKDLTNWGSANAAASVMAEWYSNMAQGSWLNTGQTANATPASRVLYPNQGSTGGFTFIDQSNPPTYSKLAITAINGSTFVVSMSSTAGLNVGDYVRLINVAGALELSGFLYQITALTANTSITLGMAATAATAKGSTYGNGTTGFVQKVYPGFMYPALKQVMFITQATQATVYFARPHDFTIGELVDFQIPTNYGMTQLSNLTGRSGQGPFSSNPAGAARVITTTNTATESSIVIDVDTSGYTAFTYPTSASFIVVGNASPPTCFPAGSGVVPLITGTSTGVITGSPTIPASPPGTNLQDAFDNHAQYVMNLGTSVVGAASASMVVMAFKADFPNNSITNA